MNEKKWSRICSYETLYIELENATNRIQKPCGGGSEHEGRDGGEGGPYTTLFFTTYIYLRRWVRYATFLKLAPPLLIPSVAYNYHKSFKGWDFSSTHLVSGLYKFTQEEKVATKILSGKLVLICTMHSSKEAAL